MQLQAYRSSRFVRKTHLGCPACVPVFWQAASKVHWTFELPNTHHVECVALLVKAYKPLNERDNEKP